MSKNDKTISLSENGILSVEIQSNASAWCGIIC